MQTPESEPAPSAASITAALVERLMRSDEEAWHAFLRDHHTVFVKAVQTASWRCSMRIVAGALPQLVDDAKTYFYAAFLRTFRSFETEGRFFAFLFRTVGNFLKEQVRGNRRAFRSLDDCSGDGRESDDGESTATRQLAVDRWEDSGRGPDPGLVTRINRCVALLPQAYRDLIVLHFYQDEPRPLRALADVFGATVDTIHKRFQRAITRLRDCLALQAGVQHASAR